MTTQPVQILSRNSEADSGGNVTTKFTFTPEIPFGWKLHFTYAVGSYAPHDMPGMHATWRLKFANWVKDNVYQATVPFAEGLPIKRQLDRFIECAVDIANERSD